MNEVLVGGALVAAMLLSKVLTGRARSYALSKGLVSLPNARSSHVVPTPLGGGVAIGLVVLLGLLVFSVGGWVSRPLLFGLLGGGLLVGIVGWLDDQWEIAPPWRLLAHFIAASWAILWLGGWPAVGVLGETVDFGRLGFALGILYVMWLINLYNFMDGIDGIAGVEAVTVCLGGVVLLAVTPVASDYSDHWVAPALVATAVCGFLFWNFPRARVFMGDAGSGFLGFTLAILALDAGGIAPTLFWGWVILQGAFVVDASVTLAHRLLRGESLYQAHRSHAYQRAARKHGSHVPVTLAFAAINLLWLLPIASVVAVGRVDTTVGVALAYAPLVGLTLFYSVARGGRVEPTDTEPSSEGG